MNTNASFSKYYDNAIKFADFSNEHHDWYDEIIEMEYKIYLSIITKQTNGIDPKNTNNQFVNYEKIIFRWFETTIKIGKNIFFAQP